MRKGVTRSNVVFADEAATPSQEQAEMQPSVWKLLVTASLSNGEERTMQLGADRFRGAMNQNRLASSAILPLQVQPPSFWSSHHIGRDHDDWQIRARRLHLRQHFQAAHAGHVDV
jgi:hypothetical protein